MGESWNWDKETTAADVDALDFTWGVDCGRAGGGPSSEWCFYREPHEHGFACDKTCPCKTDQARWRRDPESHNSEEADRG